jgi:ribulose-5-phosphate 4-epimerase/fuculose-1-phosphate aldolase
MQLSLQRKTTVPPHRRQVATSSHQLKQDVVSACHIITKLKLDSGPFGNISIRVPDTDTFWVNPEAITFDQLKPEHIVLVDIDGDVLEGTRNPHPGTFIHREIYRLRPDVSAIVHTHSENSVLISLLDCPIEPYTQLGASIHNDQEIYHGFTGPVRTSDEGADIALALGDKSIVIAKNHGLFTAAKTIQAALWDMVIADTAAKIHLSAKQLRLPSAEKLSDAYMQKSKIEVRQKQCDFMWQSYLHKLTNSVTNNNICKL